MIHYIDELKPEELKGKRVLLRLDLNAPVEDGQVMDTYRLERSIETIDFLRAHGAQTIIIAHTEGNEGSKDIPTLVPMWNFLNGYFPVEFSPTFFTPEAIQSLLELKDGGVLMFENVRSNPGEKSDDEEFSKKLATLADIYVNDAFAVSHRSHASIVGIPKFLPHYGGLLLKQEISNLSKAFAPERPFLFILGGAKFDTKLPIIQKYLDKADTIAVAGALANNFFKEMGYEIGTSLVSEGEFGIKDMLGNPKLMVPVDVTVTKPDRSVLFKKPEEVLSDECIVDVGPETVKKLKEVIETAKTIVWNGPLGNYEIGFKDKTEELAQIMSVSTATTIVGGGDTLAAIQKLGIEDKFTFVSTGGGAMLDFLVNETLPGIDALTK